MSDRAPRCDTCSDTGRIDWMIEADPTCFQEPDDYGKVPCPDCASRSVTTEAPTPGTALSALAAAADQLNTALGGGTMARQDTEENLTQLRSLRLAIEVLRQLDATYVQHLYLTAEHGKHAVDGVGEVWVTRTRSSVKWDERGTAAAIVDAKMAEREGEVPDDPMDVVTWLLEAASISYYRKGALKAMGIDPAAYVDSLPGKPQVTLDLT